MLKLPRAILPEWRGWPAISLFGLILLAVAGSSLPPLQTPQQQQQSIPAQKAENSSTKIAAEKAADDRIADYTWWLTFFTAILGAASIFQAFFLIRADRLTRKSIDLAKTQYVASHRPRLRIRKVRLQKLDKGKPIGIEYEVVNVGDTLARIVLNEATLRVDSVPNGAVYESQTLQFQFADFIANGEAVPAQKEMPIVYSHNWQYDFDYWLDGRVRIIGTILYLDNNGTARRTAFYRISTSDPNRFVKPDFEPTTAADYEYED